MDESIDPELSDGAVSHARGKHEARGTRQAGKHRSAGPRHRSPRAVILGLQRPDLGKEVYLNRL